MQVLASVISACMGIYSTECLISQLKRASLPICRLSVQVSRARTSTHFHGALVSWGVSVAQNVDGLSTGSLGSLPSLGCSLGS